MRTIEWENGIVTIIDQRKLPTQEVWVELKNYKDMAYAIKEMQLRGAPLIGVSAAYGLALTAFHSTAKTREELLKELEESAALLRTTRPTAVNLFWAIDRVMKKAQETKGTKEQIAEAVVNEANIMADEDVETNRKMGKFGATLIEEGDTVLTHCNAGSLATVDYGTALGVIRAAIEEGKNIQVISCETRPRQQGAKLTCYELMRDNIPVTLISDTMVGYVMSQGMVDKVVVGADRIVRDGVLNKIGTYNVAVLASEHGIPFYVAAPMSTMDQSLSSEDAVIEERSPTEITNIGCERIAPEGIKVLNPAFDITPLEYVDAVITEKGIFRPEMCLKQKRNE
ncbi:MAG: S-methyl-5-thioribose-1-phosphate isomerase [Candidatus Bathyarchaeota archaeon]|nr:MAG: S-methyl-5-thioribose-1-phosphate isomerase [Candidatus Bathyarchaeota archaeon]